MNLERKPIENNKFILVRLAKYHMLPNTRR